jgi:putative transposase
MIRFYKDFFEKRELIWSDGYFSCSIGNVSNESIKKYIQEQG